MGRKNALRMAFARSNFVIRRIINPQGRTPENAVSY
jgi:hypothetical protein